MFTDDPLTQFTDKQEKKLCSIKKEEYIQQLMEQ